MIYNDFLDRIINDGIAAATADYVDDEPRRIGAVAGFNACRQKSPEALLELFRVSAGKMQKDYFGDKDNYWYSNSYWAEVQWVCNCVSAMLYNEGLPTIIPPTVRGMMKAAEICGVAA